MSDFQVVIPEHLLANVPQIFGERGTAWLEQLPQLLAHAMEKWSLSDLGDAFLDGFTNFVAPVTRADGTEAVLKVGVPDKERVCEMNALRLYDGDAAVRLLDAEPDGSALLLERVRPGTQLAELPDDDEATRIAARIMLRLWRPVPPGHSYVTVFEWMEGFERLRKRFDGGTGPLPAALVEKAEGLYAEFETGPIETLLLHGDCHHHNILASDRQPWVIIDPKGLVGDPGFEVGAFLGNPIGIGASPDLARIARRRLDILAEMLERDWEGLRRWSFIMKMLDAWWCVEDNAGEMAEAVRFAEILDDMARR